MTLECGSVSLFFFFFQAEDGIRDLTVTGVQTCALPIYFPALAHSLYFHLREDFAVPHVALRVWGKAVPADFTEAEAVDEAQRQLAAAMGAPQCGPAAASPFIPWFREAAEHVRSVALVPLGESVVFGLLALGSEDPQRFFPEMGTLYLRRIGELCAAGVSARL